MSNALEAVFAAIFLDGGYKLIYSVIERLFASVLENIEEESFSRDYKTRLQQYTQEIFKTKPVYKMVRESGPDHKKSFDIKIYIEDEVKASGTGSSKKQAEQDAARNFLEKLVRKK